MEQWQIDEYGFVMESGASHDSLSIIGSTATT